MIHYKSIGLLYGIMLILIVLFSVISRHFFTLYFIVIIVSMLFVFFLGSISVCAGFYTRVICKAETKNKEIAISFDDGPHPEYTPAVLEILKAANIPATFFVIGERAEKNPELIRRIYEEGHIIGNHSYKHGFWFDMKCKKGMIAEMKKTDEVVKNIISRSPDLFRPPYGVTSPALDKAVKNRRYKVIGWNIRSFDKSAKPVEKIVRRVSGKMQPGSIILLHDDHPGIPEILEGIIEEARKKSLSFVELDKILNIDAYKNA